MKELFKKLSENKAHLKENLEILSTHSGKVVFSTSFGIEDQVITDAILSQKIESIEVFTLDTGRLFSETYHTWDKTLMKYHSKIKAYYPNQNSVERFVEKNGINSFYESIDLRKECCRVRKVEPLQRALSDVQIWITGLRAEQSNNRNSMQLIEWDETYQLYKYNPLLHWTMEDVRHYIETNRVPYNSLHDKGFISIGCAPCTRAIKEGEDFRAGRWWWEDTSKKECGLHTH